MKLFTKENIRFVTKTEMLIGEEIAQNLPQHLMDNLWQRVGVVVDKGVYENNQYILGIVKLLESKLGKVILLIN